MTLTTEGLNEMRATLLLLCYNQEEYVANAIEAALAQECEPINILISDDASHDDSYSIIQSAVRGYDGPHNVQTHRNLKNLGIAEHINSSMKRITTDYIIAASADDISKPQRVNSLLRAFDQTDALLAHSYVEEIDVDGNAYYGRSPGKSTLFYKTTSAEIAFSKMALYIGASGAWHRSLFEKFGDLDEGCYEDLILGFRAALESRVVCVEEKLVRYRVGIGVSSKNNVAKIDDNWNKLRLQDLTLRSAVIRQRLKDVIVSSHRSRTYIADCLRNELKLNTIRLELYKSPFASIVKNNLELVPLIVRAVLSERNAKRLSIRRLKSKK